MRAVVVLNPNATTTSVRTRDVLLAALDNDLDIEVAETTHRGHATELARQARLEGVNLVVSVGGDGTINEIANGLLAPDVAPQPDQAAVAPQPDPADVPAETGSTGTPAQPGGAHAPSLPDIAIIPGGSTNVLARNLGIPENPVEATGLLLDALRSGRRQNISLGRLDDRYFTFAAGFGFDADVIHAVEDERALGRTSTVGLYVRTAIRRFAAQPDRRHGTIRIVDEPAVGVSGLAVVIVSNCTPWTYIGRRPLWPTPCTDLNGGLDVFGLTSLSFIPTVWHLFQLISRRGPRGRGVVSLHDRDRLILETPEPLPVQVDGDYIGRRSRIELASVPNALRVAY